MRSHKVEASFSVEAHFPDIYRVYAKIAVNCLATLKGCEEIVSEKYDAIKHAILTGENIEEYVWLIEGSNTILDLMEKFTDKVELGSKCHTTIILYKEGILYGIVSLYGTKNPVVVKLAEGTGRANPDFYICDWENHRDYTMMDYVVKICEHTE